MTFVAVTILAIAAAACGDLIPPHVHVHPMNTVEIANDLAKTNLVLAFVVFRHGDRTPDLDELSFYDTGKDYSEIFFPFGPKALTNEGKRRSYKVGEYLRWRYDGFLSRLYLPNEVNIRTTDFARTKMTALAALAALYPPGITTQRWNQELDWQPVPYDTLPFNEDDLMYYYNCPRYNFLRNVTYNLPEVRKVLEPYEYLFKYLTEHTGTNITTTEDVFYLDNLFQTLTNVGVETPQFAIDVMSDIQEITKIEYQLEFYNTEMIKLATGVMMNEIIKAMEAAIDNNNGNDLDQPKMRLVSAHENNVAAWMAASKVFKPHQPSYGATFSLQLRKDPANGQYGVMAMYSPIGGAPSKTLHIEGCEEVLCKFEIFRNLTKDYILTHDEYKSLCAVTVY